MEKDREMQGNLERVTERERERERESERARKREMMKIYIFLINPH